MIVVIFSSSISRKIIRWPTFECVYPIRFFNTSTKYQNVILFNFVIFYKQNIIYIYWHKYLLSCIYNNLIVHRAMSKLLKQDLILPDGVNVIRLFEFQVVLVTVSYPKRIKWHTTTVTSTVITQTIHINFHMYVVCRMTPKMVTTMVTITLYNTVHWHGN